ncbi:hypothetical protein F5Y14DRAFT_457525 [Nemania sp. NC0429]|nr:hypothetical protein F5Y14DRAFT_457525 [Nemania sp. NC0429]
MVVHVSPIPCVEAGFSNSAFLPGVAVGGPQGFADDMPLGFAPSVIASTYLCQVPARKGRANLVISLIVADLVFIRVLWALFCLAARRLYLHQDPDANSCEGCGKISKTNGYQSVGQQPD